jgi:hypothetical protein
VWTAAPGTRVVGEAFTLDDDDITPVRGFVGDGGIQGRNIDFTISWIEESDTTWTFNGFVGDDGLVHRGFMHGPGFMSLWDSTSPLLQRSGHRHQTTTGQRHHSASTSNDQTTESYRYRALGFRPPPEEEHGHAH